MCTTVGTNIRRTRTRYILYPERENILADAISIFTQEGIPNTIHKYSYTTEIMSELYSIDDLPEGTFTLSFKLTDHYQW